MESSTFSALHIGATALAAGAIALLVSYWRLRPRSWLDAAAISTVVAVATFAWRLPANVHALNSDGVPGFSANDLLAPIVTYILLGMYANWRRLANPDQFNRLRSVLAGVALAVNVITI
jgi:hypothetical protein